MKISCFEKVIPGNYIENMAALHKASFYKGWSVADIAEIVIANDCLIIIAREGEFFCGFAIFRLAADEAEILTIAVKKETRHQGIGTKILEAGLKELKIRDIKNIFLEVDATDEITKKFYEKLGFEIISTRKNYYDRQFGKTDALVMRKSSL